MQNKTAQTFFATLVLASGALSSLALAGDAATVDPKIATRITISGCVHAGSKPGQFVLVGVTERAPDGQINPVPYAIYWLDSNKELKSMVGGFVDVTGTVLKRDSKRGFIKISVRPDEEKTADVTVENGNQKGTTTKEYAGAVNEESTVEITRPVYRITVESIKSLDDSHMGPACK